MANALAVSMDIPIIYIKPGLVFIYMILFDYKLKAMISKSRGDVNVFGSYNIRISRSAQNIMGIVHV